MITWRWLFQELTPAAKKWFSRPPEASISRTTKLFGVRRDQISSYKPPMLDYTCVEHVVNTRWLNEKKCSKNVDFYPKNQRFLSIFSHLVNACWPHVHRTCNPTLDTWRHCFGPFYPKRFNHTTHTRFGGSRKPYFFPTKEWWNNHLHFEELDTIPNVAKRSLQNGKK